jgi:hypothetical protein
MRNKKAILCVPFYTPSLKKRYDELLFTLQQNLRHSWLVLIILMIDDHTFTDEQPPHSKILIHRTEGRPTYADWITLSSNHAPAIDLSICANADIELSHDFLDNALREMSVPRTLMCITRYDLSDSGQASLRVNPHWTQDTWCLSAAGVREALQTLMGSLLVPFGTPRCDNRIPYVFWLRGWRLSNPCERVVTLHHQKDTARAYSKKDITILGSVAFVHPSPSGSESSDIDIDIFSLNSAEPRTIQHNKFLVDTDLTAHSCLTAHSQISILPSNTRDSCLLLGGQLVSRGAIDLGQWSLHHHFNDRFKIYKKDENIAFVDLSWPSLWLYEDPGISHFTPQQIQQLFCWGFCTPVTEFIPNQFSPNKLFPAQKNFWQYPCRTEQDAYERHARINGLSCSKNEVNTYVGLPWATWIDKRDLPSELLRAFGERFAAIRSFLADSGVSLNVHTVCQHILWKQDEFIKSFELAGVNQLWIAHKEKFWDVEGQLHLHSWPLYAVNVLDPERRDGLEFVPVEKKSIFASFKGAHMQHYISDIRLRLKELSYLEGYEVAVSDLWHFNKLVYNYQIANIEGYKRATEKQEMRSYNQLLSQTMFSLCPGGAGPNTLRLWESLGIGSIPVVLSDCYEFPSLERMGMNNASWYDAVIVIAEADLEHLPDRLLRLKRQQRQRLQSKGKEFFDKCRIMTCFS